MKFLTSILGLIAIIAVGRGVGGWFVKSVVTRATTDASTCLEMLGSTTTEDAGATYIIGNVKNGCDHRIDSVTVIFKLDRPPESAEYLPQGDAYAYVRDVKPGETRPFKSALPVSRNTTYRFDGINAF
jgi:hypothetical protein